MVFDREERAQEGKIEIAVDKANQAYKNMHKRPEMNILSPGQEVIVDHLDRLEVVKIILDKYGGSEPEQKILLLLQNDQIQVLSLDKLMIMSTKELKYIHYLLRVEDETSSLWSNMILSNIRKKILDDGLGSTSRKANPTISDRLCQHHRAEEIEAVRGEMRRGLDWGWGGDEEEGVFEEENWASVLDTDADERLLRNKEERGIGKMGKRKKVAYFCDESGDED
ncbi:hypothetical protein AgCh_025292 [Apium graveolens]